MKPMYKYLTGAVALFCLTHTTQALVITFDVPNQPLPYTEQGVDFYISEPSPTPLSSIREQSLEIGAYNDTIGVSFQMVTGEAFEFNSFSFVVAGLVSSASVSSDLGHHYALTGVAGDIVLNWSGVTSITFTTTTVPNAVGGVYVDIVDITPVPEPGATLFVTCMILPALMCLQRRRRR